jgi:hypothetical protein
MGVRIKFIPSWVLILLMSSCGAAAQTEDSFTREMLDLFKQEYPRSKFEIAEPLTLTRDKGKDLELRINLHRIWDNCQNVPAECGQRKIEYVTKTDFTSMPKPVRETLRVMVRDKQYVGYLESLPQKEDEPAGRTAVYRKIGDDLFAFLAQDSTERIALVSDETLKDLGLNEDAAFALAKRQTEAILPKISATSIKLNGATGFEGKEYLSALLYGRERWDEIASLMGPDTVTSDQFVFVGTLPSGPGLEKFRESVESDCQQAGRCVSPNIYRYRDGLWVLAR